MNNQTRWLDLLVPIGIISCLMIIFVPLPPAIMDVLLATNISLAVIILLTTVFIKTPLELSVFPAILVMTTLARIALNIGTTRLILTKGATDGELAAGGVIQSFGAFVTGNNLAVGLVIFAIIVVVQFVVITKGATRISEVAARFTLDGMPGQQMSIDAQLNSGAISVEEASEKREQVAAQSDFFGAMDGASKFVRGDAVAGVLITLINIAGGLVIGLTSGMSITEAAAVFTKLTIGDGLVSQLPALLVSLSAAMLVTRSNRPVNLPRETINQMFSRPVVLVITACFLGALVFTQLPSVPMLLLGATCLAIAYTVHRGQPEPSATPVAKEPKPPAATETTLEKLLGNDVLEMELGVGLIQLADPRQGGNLLAAITGIRKQLAEELGLVLPKVRVRDNLGLDALQYRILIQGNPANEGQIAPDCYLAVDTGQATGPIEKEQIRGMFNDNLHPEPAYWINESAKDSAIESGYVVMTATDVLADQLRDLSIEHAPNLLTRDATQQLIDEISNTSPTVVSELIPDIMTLGQVQRVLKSLLVEQVSIRPLALILETLGDHATTTNHWALTEKVRMSLARHVTHQLKDGKDGIIYGFTISDDLQKQISESWEQGEDEIRLTLPRTVLERLVIAINDASMQMIATGRRPIAFVHQSIRPVIAQIALETSVPLAVLGDREIGKAPFQVVGEISADQVNTLESNAA